MVARRAIMLLLLLAPLAATAQEVLSPVLCRPAAQRPQLKEPPAALRLPLFDDFATGMLNPALWQQEGGAEVSSDVSPLAPTVGVLTLDALDVDGSLYASASANLFPADTATSLPIRLEGLSPADSVVLSFYYLPGGGYGNMWERMGYAPDTQDSLFLDFYRATDSLWVNVWSCAGTTVDELLALTDRSWQYVVVTLGDSGFFDSTFRFRFRNFASLESTPKAGKAGNCDFWHIDYVMMDTARSVVSEPAVRDIAFAAPAPSVLRYYRAMPFNQYRASEMAASIQMKITNRYSSELASQYSYSLLDSNGVSLHTYDGGFENAPPFMPAGQYQTATGHAEPPVEFSFPAMTGPTDFTLLHVVHEGSAGDDYGDNDTLRQQVSFAEYFAYDDGTAENGYSLTSSMSSMFLAYRFDLNEEDTLTAIDLYFNSTMADANMSIPFYLTLWRVGDDGRPDGVVYRDNSRRYSQGVGFHRYMLERGVVVSGSVFVGLEQSGNDFINIGFDRSRNTADRIYQLTDTAWRQSLLSGSLMLRPCFGVAATVGMDAADGDVLNFKVFPNPARERLFVEGSIEDAVLYDMFGRRVACMEGTSIDTRNLLPGMYVLRARMVGGDIMAKKIVIRH